MGVRGLTTYIYNNSNKFFDSFMLQNSDIVIDGNCLATILFYNSITNTASFGGDYDKFAKAIEKFFLELLKCHINPFVIFDGGYEKKKLQTVYNRNKNKVLSLFNIGPTHHSKMCFPLMMRQVFRDKLKEMNIPFAQSDFEADQEIAALARKLQCPVLSNDSDFFIYDVVMIPINEFSLEADTDSNGHYYMNCLVYKVDKFLKSLGDLPKSHLPLLAALLGNDYISSATFANFYSQMKITRGRKQNQIHCRVQGIISWLKKETYESALNKILCHLKKNKQKKVATKVAQIIQSYSQVSTPLDAYLVKEDQTDSDSVVLYVEDLLKQYDSIDILESTEEQSEILCSGQSDESENEECNTDENGIVKSNDSEALPSKAEFSSFKPSFGLSKFKELSSNAINLPMWLIHYSRGGNVPSCIITLFSLKIYFSIPQVEDYELGHAGLIGLPILSKIAGILIGDDVYSYYCRTQKCKYACVEMSTSTTCGRKRIPLVSSLNQLNLSQRKDLFLDIFEIDSDLLDVINSFPEKWYLFIFSVKYWVKNLKELSFHCYYIHAVAIMIVCIRVIESKIGYFRNKRPFMQRYASKMKKPDNSEKAVTFDDVKKIDDIISSIPLEECLIACEIFLPYFQIEERLKTNAKFFSRSTIHAISQLQVCIDLAYTLNSLLEAPFDSLPVYNFLNSTFLYNFCTNFKKRTNIAAYVGTLLVRCPTLLKLHNKVVELFSCFMTVPLSPQVSKKRRKKKKIVKNPGSTVLSTESDKEVSSYSDEDNAFSLLSKLTLR